MHSSLNFPINLQERDDKDVRDREVRRLTTELAHAKAGNASAVAAAKV